MAKESKKFVKIQSSMTVRVTAGLDFDDFTKKNSDVPNRMKIAPKWPKLMYTIKQGNHTYPIEIIEWKSVQALKDKGILTIGEYTDVDADEALDGQKRINNAIAEMKAKSLSEIAGD